MAKDNKNLNKISNGVTNMMSKLYSQTYFTNPTLKNDISNLTSDIHKNIDRISNNNIDNVGSPNISKVYNRLTIGSKEDAKKIEELFSDEKFMDSVLANYMQNKMLKDMQDEIDIVCKYMPKLSEALDVKKDNVLSADHFSKDFIHVQNATIGYNKETFNERIEEIKKKYDLNTLIEEAYMDASKYGETFLYIIPYSKALNKLLSDNNPNNMNTINLSEGRLIVSENGIGSNKTSDILDYINADITEGNLKMNLEDKTSTNIIIEFNMSNMITSVVENAKTIDDKIGYINEQSMSYLHETGILNEADKMDVTIPNDLNVDTIKTKYKDKDYVKDGLVNTDKGKIKQGFPGAVVKKLDRLHVIPIYIEDICMGYYYVEYNTNNYMNEVFNLNDPILSMKQGTTLMTQENDPKRDNIIKYMASEISKQIDAKFINNNQDLRKEIYSILKYNDVYNKKSVNTIKVTFIPPSDMIHIYFNKDRYSHRGISDLARALLPAKLYSSIYVANVVGILTRGQDKRVYYVNQSVDTNISKVLLETVNQIKKSNFGIRQIENLNNVLNITGRFNDYIIPRGPNGSPIDFEILQGQNIEIKTELMSILEEMAVNTTDVPIELILARQSMDYAIQYTMSNSKFLRKIYNRQAKTEPFLSRLISMIYSYEYNEDTTLSLTLPPPMFLNITNTNQIINNTKDFVNSIVEFELADEPDEKLRMIYTKDLLYHHLGTYIDIAKHSEILHRAKMKAETQSKEEEQ